MKRIIKTILILLLVVVVWFWLAKRPLPEKIDYGVSFSKFHSDELKLDWRKVYLALLNDLKVKNLRLTAHWPMIEPQEGKYNFAELDYQMAEARKRNISVILAVGRRLPGWPECHEPDWIKQQAVSNKQQAILKYIETLLNRYKDFPNLKYWQVENEPFLGFFARSHCGSLDINFLEQEIALARKLDPAHPVLLTDSGEFGAWGQAWRRGDVFGSSMYLYIWSQQLGPLRYPIGPSFFRVKQKVMEMLFGEKPKILIELSAEPWLLAPIVDTSLEVQLQRMGLDKFDEMIDFAGQTGFAAQYLWGAEWWYWMKEHDHPEFWERAKRLF